MQLLQVWQARSPGERMPKGTGENCEEGRFKFERGYCEEGRKLVATQQATQGDTS